MARVEQWIGDFIAAHTARCPRQDWPLGASEADRVFWDAWRCQFIRRGVTLEAAEEASERLAGDPPGWLGEHLPAVLRTVAEVIRERADQSSGVESDPLKAAARDSANCLDCGGSGWAARFVHSDIHGRLNNANGDPVPVGASVAIPCGCPLGRQVASASGHRLTVDQYPSLRLREVPWSDAPDNKYRHRPSAWHESDGMPFDAGLVIETPGDLRRLCLSLTEPAAQARPRASYPAPAPADPVIDRERRRGPAVAQPAIEDLVMPEDDWTRWP